MPVAILALHGGSLHRLNNKEMSELQLEATIVNTLSDVRNAYWNLVYAVEAVEVARQVELDRLQPTTLQSSSVTVLSAS
jgi:hypothetical protein